MVKPPLKTVPQLTPGDVGGGAVEERLTLEQNTQDSIPLLDRLLGGVTGLFTESAGQLNPGRTTTTTTPQSQPAPPEKSEWRRDVEKQNLEKRQQNFNRW